MKELNICDLERVSGGVSQDTAIASNLAIAVLGFSGTLATFPAWGPILLTGVSIAITTSYIESNLMSSGGSGTGRIRSGTLDQIKEN